MCGICGEYNYRSGKPANKEKLIKMANSIIHRGPDDSGIDMQGSIGLSFRRLSILDLSIAGHQPMKDSDGIITIVFNGEIFNFNELRAELRNRGYSFQSNTDTEVIIYAYKQWGEEFLDRMNGMFGLALWDKKQQKLIIARDRIGIKPIYYHESNDGIVFSSEIKALFEHGCVIPEVEPGSVYNFLRYRYTPAPETIYSGVKKLAPGMAITIENGSKKIWRWWNYRPNSFLGKKREDKVIQELSEIYTNALRRHLISDVPVGLLLSGGVDSALLLAMMKKEKGDWKTFSVGYGSLYEDDELQDAMKTAEYFNSDHHQVLIDQNMFNRSLPKIISYLEEPVATSSIVPMYYVCQRARQDVTVALVGQGPDELFGGYNRHVGIRIGEYYRYLPKRMRSFLEKIFKKKMNNELFRRALFALSDDDRKSRYQNVFSIEDASLIGSLFSEDSRENILNAQPIFLWDELTSFISDADELTGFQYLELRSSLPDELLMYSDKLSMAHSLELRVPYVDKEIVEYAEGLSQSLKMSCFKRKYIHKRVAKRFLPREIINRKKRAFASNVVKGWFRESVDTFLLDSIKQKHAKIYSFLDYNNVQDLIKANQNGMDYHKLIFSLIVLEQVVSVWG
ncbi:MAG: asparagine synthase (glutamine-hydrolyzing) [Eubacteriales bacterium]